MLHRKYLAIAALLTSVSLAGCGDKDESEASSLISAGDLQGTWLGDCRKVGDVYGKTTYTFTDSTFTYQSAEYSDEGCTSLDNNIFGRGIFRLAGDFSTEKGVVLAAIDYEYAAISWSFVAKPSLATDWSLICENATIQNNTLDVLGKKCVNGTSTLNFSAESFGSLWPSEGKIYLTDINSNGDTLETRSEKIDTEFGGLTKLVVVEDVPAE